MSSSGATATGRRWHPIRAGLQRRSRSGTLYAAPVAYASDSSGWTRNRRATARGSCNALFPRLSASTTRTTILIESASYLLAVNAMPRDKRLAELARSLHRASERLWLRVTNPASYEITEADIQALQKANTDLNRAITKLKMKTRK